MKPLKIASFVFSPLLGLSAAGFILLKYGGVPVRYFAYIAIAGLVLSFINGVIVTIGISKKQR